MGVPWVAPMSPAAEEVCGFQQRSSSLAVLRGWRGRRLLRRRWEGSGRVLDFSSGPKTFGWALWLSGSSPSPGAGPEHCRLRAESCCAGRARTLLTAGFQAHGPTSPIMETRTGSRPRPGPLSCYRGHSRNLHGAFCSAGCSSISTRARVLPPQAPHPSVPHLSHHCALCLPTTTLPFLQGGSAQGVTHRMPGHAGA